MSPLVNKETYYQQRINKAVAYLSENLHDDIRISTLANVANFSVFHFQRIYKALQNETPYETLLRLRLEKAIFLLKYRKNLKISEIAFDSGFASAENFSRQFKARFGCSASAFRKNKELQNQKIHRKKSPDDFYHSIEESRQVPGPSYEVTIEKVETISVALIRAIFGTDGMILVQRYQELMAWAQSHDLPFQGPRMRFGMSVDDPEVTPANHYRYDFALRVAEKPPLEGLIEYSQIPGGNFATIHCQGKLTDVAQAWDFLYKVWLPESGYIPLHHPAIEDFIQGPEEIGWEDFNLKCRIPVVKMKDKG